MIEGAGGLTTTLQNNRISQYNSTGGVTRQQTTGEAGEQSSANQGHVADKVTFSAQAIALAKNVPPTGGTNETNEPKGADQGGEGQEQQRRGINIRV